MRTQALLIAALPLALLAQEPAPTDSTGLPGDQFSLQGALELFKDNIELEVFEKALNTEDNHVNNLDLNNDGQVDYVRVEALREGDAVVVTLRVPVSATENQDVAVIEIEKVGPDSAILQIRGDEDLYPEGTIVEPFAEVEGAAKEGKGPSAPALLQVQVVVNVWSWRPVPFCFSPRFFPFSSVWVWGNYPPWWRPWRPHPWRVWWGWGFRYRTWYRPWPHCRVVRAHAVYAPRRVRSAAVRTRYEDAHIRHARTRPAPAPATRPAMKNTGKAKPAKTRPATKPATKPMTKPAVRPAPNKVSPRPPRAPKGGRK